VPFFPDGHIFSRKIFYILCVFWEIARVFKITKNYFLFMAVSGICTVAVSAESNQPHAQNSGRTNAREMLNATNAVSENFAKLAGKF
jgi:hypothetical protein